MLWLELSFSNFKVLNFLNALKWTNFSFKVVSLVLLIFFTPRCQIWMTYQILHFHLPVGNAWRNLLSVKKNWKTEVDGRVRQVCAVKKYIKCFSNWSSTTTLIDQLKNCGNFRKGGQISSKIGELIPHRSVPKMQTRTKTLKCKLNLVFKVILPVPGKLSKCAKRTDIKIRKCSKSPSGLVNITIVSLFAKVSRGFFENNRA